jgi:hypothetical protein
MWMQRYNMIRFLFFFFGLCLSSKVSVHASAAPSTSSC